MLDTATKPKIETRVRRKYNVNPVNPPGPKPTYTPELIEKEADALMQYLDSTSVPLLKDFCYKRGYGSQVISEVFVYNVKFSEALNRYKDKVETSLVYGALTNKINCTMSIFALKNVAGWRDQIDHNVSGDLFVRYGYRDNEGAIDAEVTKPKEIASA